MQKLPLIIQFYSYGRYDQTAVWGTLGTLGSGILVKGKREFLLNSDLKSHNIVIFEINISDSSINKIEEQYENIIKYFGVSWLSQRKKDEPEIKYKERLKNNKYYKLKNNKYEQYEFLDGDNCATIISDSLKHCGNKSLYELVKDCVAPIQLRENLTIRARYQHMMNNEEKLIKSSKLYLKGERVK